MTTTRTKSESQGTESKKEERKKNRYHSKEKEEAEDLEGSTKKHRKKEEEHPLSESFSLERSCDDKFTRPHKSPSAPTLSVSDGDLQMVVAEYDHSQSQSQSQSFSLVREVVKDAGEIELELGANGESNSKEERKWLKVLLALRIVAFVLCKIAFSLLAANNHKYLLRVPSYSDGNYVEFLDQLHWYYYPEFRYCLSINVIGFAYCGLQGGDLIKYLITKRHTVDPKLRGYYNIAMDQGLAYLLMSASSSAATRAQDFRHSNGMEYKFMQMANASVAFSLLAFVTFVSSSIVSAFILSRFN